MKLWKNTEIKKITVIFILFLIISLILSFIATHIIINNYETYFINYNAHIINIIKSKYPDAEKNTIISLLHSDDITKSDLSNLNKYGITKSDLLTSINSVKAEYHNVMIINITLSLIIAILFLTVIFIFLSRLYKKINKLSKYTLDVMNGKGNIDIIDNEEGELSILKNRLYDITRILKENNELLEKDKETLKRAIADISHQLKTPLTSLYLCNEILYDETDSHQREVFLNKMRQELERIEWLISSLLKMSKLDSRTIVLKKDEINTKDLIESTLLSLSSVIDSKNINIIKDGNDNINIKGDFNWLREALSNIIKNSVEHTSNGGNINISYLDNPLYVEINIKDNGEGIDKEDLPYIFDRFYKAKGSSKESVGIGLSLSKTIINNSDGDITVRSKKDEYTLFTIKLYKNEW